MRNKHIYAIVVRDFYNDIVAAKVRSSDWSLQDWDQERTLTAYLHQRTIMERQGEEVGTVDLYLTDKFMREELAQMIRMRVLILFILLVAIVLTLVAIIAFSISRPLEHLMGTFERIAGGNLDECIDTSRRDEIGRLAASFALLRDTIRQKIRDTERLNHKLDQQITERTAEVEALQRLLKEITNAAEHLTQVSQGMTQISLEMARSAEQTSQQVQNVSTYSQHVSHHIHDISTSTEEMTASIHEIHRTLQDVTAGIANAVETSTFSNTIISELQQHSQEIGNILKIITSITQQTNLLALNATIEAARAGEYGKGFAVVAGEVKELARETTAAAEHITHKIETIQSSSQRAAEAMQNVADRTNQTAELTDVIAAAISEQSHVTEEISTALAKTVQGSEVITDTITQVAEAAQDSSERATRVQAEASQLASLAEQLRQLVQTVEM